jgi:AbrB family looped-hinge helix DNA binding protein
MPMAITRLSSKGQVVLPKPVRDALRLRPGARLGVRVEGSCVILEPEHSEPTDSWQPLNPAGVRLKTRELCRPVDLTRSTDETRSR